MLERSSLFTIIYSSNSYAKIGFDYDGVGKLVTLRVLEASDLIGSSEKSETLDWETSG